MISNGRGHSPGCLEDVCHHVDRELETIGTCHLGRLRAARLNKVGMPIEGYGKNIGVGLRYALASVDDVGAVVGIVGILNSDACNI